MIGGVFLLTLLVVSVVTIRISDMVLDSRVGALDRTLGFLFGLGRGLIIVVVAFAFFDWLVPAKAQPAVGRGCKVESISGPDCRLAAGLCRLTWKPYMRSTRATKVTIATLRNRDRISTVR